MVKTTTPFEGFSFLNVRNSANTLMIASSGSILLKGSDVVLPNNQTVEIVYDGTTWIHK